MALILYGNGVADIRGSINGTTFARSRSGAYARNRTVPINPMTVSQTANRVRFGSQASGWTALTQANKDSWIALASGATRLNRLGQAYTPTGRQLYLESSNNMALAGLPVLTSAPINADIPAGSDIATFDANQTAGSWTTMELNGGSAVGGFSAIVKATPPNPGPKTNFVNQYRNIGTYATGASIDILADYIAAFGPAPGTIGSPASVLVSILDDATGFRSSELRLDTLVV